MIPCQLIHKYSPLLTVPIFAFVCKMWLNPPGQMCRSLSHLRIQYDHLPEGFVSSCHRLLHQIHNLSKIICISRLQKSLVSPSYYGQDYVRSWPNLSSAPDYPVVRSRISISGPFPMVDYSYHRLLLAVQFYVS